MLFHVVLKQEVEALHSFTLKNQTELSVVSSCIFALSPVTPNRPLGASLRWASGSDDK